MRLDNKFTLGQKVFLTGDDKAWFVTGIRAKIAYNVFCWAYEVTRIQHGLSGGREPEMRDLGCGYNYESKSELPEEKLLSIEAHMAELQERLQKDIEFKQRELLKLQRELEASLGVGNT